MQTAWRSQSAANAELLAGLDRVAEGLGLVGALGESIRTAISSIMILFCHWKSKSERPASARLRIADCLFPRPDCSVDCFPVRSLRLHFAFAIPQSERPTLRLAAHYSQNPQSAIRNPQSAIRTQCILNPAPLCPSAFCFLRPIS